MTFLFWQEHPVEQYYKRGYQKRLESGYSEPHRAYHDWSHISDLLQKLDAYSHYAVRADLIAHAILWHDVVYQTQNPDGSARSDSANVKDSADEFLKFSKLPANEKNAVYAMIMATSKHRNPDATLEFYPGFYKDRDLFLDLDISSLAADESEFDANTNNIRKEFAWVAEKDFCRGRADILIKFAEVRPTYKTPDLEYQWGSKARANLYRSAAKLAALARD